MTSQLDWYSEEDPRPESPPAPSPGPGVRLLCAGDLHLGRRSTRLPDHVDGSTLSAAQSWLAMVDVAIERCVDAVLLSGDVVDRANRYFEAFGPLESGLRRLADAGITTWLVAGNHDFDVLPRLVDSMDAGSVRLLGRDGRWERATLEVGGRPALHVDGWSFPAEHVRSDPLAGYLPEASELPVVGLLHADLDQPSSRYAPVPAAALRAQPVGLWVLGHVHQSWLSARAGAASLLYTGSLQALDPGEPGAHGAWLVEIGPGRVRCEPVPLSSVRYDTLELELEDGLTEDLEGMVATRVRDHLEEVAAESPRLALLSLRLRLTGRVRDPRRAEDGLTQLARELQVVRGRASAHVERVVVEARPAADLDALARGSDPPAVVARMLLALEQGGSEADRLIRAAEQKAAEVRKARPYLPLVARGESPSADDVPPTATLLRRQAFLLLDSLLAQKEG